LIFYWTSFPSFAIFGTRNTLVNKQNYQPMKKTCLSSCSSALVLAAGLFAATFPAAGQSILININEANPSAVQFIATVTVPLGNDSSQYNLFGVDLLNYFTASVVASGGVATGTLTPAGTTNAYTQWFPDNLHVVNNVDLNLYATATSQIQTFSTSSPAFTGTAIINLSSLFANLPSTGASGNIYSGDAHSQGGLLIGRWTVVPEPSVEAQLALGAMVFAGLALVRRARRVAARR
jgi:hypothetical protein